VGEEWGDESGVDCIWFAGEYDGDGVYACDTDALGEYSFERLICGLSHKDLIRFDWIFFLFLFFKNECYL
jgi:hypothetical protein